MKSGRAITWTLLGLVVTALVALALEVLDRRSVAVAVLQLGMLVSLGTGVALDRRWADAERRDPDEG